MNPTLRLLRFIGSPYAQATPQMEPENTELVKLHELSRKNRMRFQFLEALDRKMELGDFAPLYAKEKKRCAESAKAICNVSKVLANSGIAHAIFKTLRPYRSTTVDIDTLVFGKECERLRASKSLLDEGYQMVVAGPRSTTLLDPKSGMGVDLYDQVAVSYLIYIEKEKLVDFVTTTNLLESNVKILRPEADLAAIIAHSVIKEQMYTLSEYYTFLYYLNSLNVEIFLEALRKNNLTTAAATHASITGLLHKLAHGTIPNPLLQIIDGLGGGTQETRLLVRNNIKTPHKYQYFTLADSFLEIMRGKKCRDSFASQIAHMSNPRFLEKFAKDLLKHITRKTY